MSPLAWFLVVVAAGVVLLAAAVLVDRRQRRTVTGAGEPAPRRGVESVDRIVPRYVTQDEIDAMPSPAADPSGGLPHRGEGFGFGHAHPDFATGSAGAELTGPRFLVIDGDVTSMRELLAPLGTATAESPLVLVAAHIADEVLVTLAANRRALGMPVVAAVAGTRDRRRLAELTGATPVAEDDLRSGYVPPAGYGTAAAWSSTGARAWVQPA